MAIPSAITSLLRPLYEFVYPPICFLCESPLGARERKVCTRCWERIKPVCLTDELYREMEDRLRSSGYLDGLVSMFLFEKEGALQSLLHELKYNGMTSIGVELGKRLGELMCSVLDISRITGMTAVPLHRVKRRERGYNQSEWIAEGIHRVTGVIQFPGLLTRVRNTASQTRLTIDERRGNVSDAFSLDPSRHPGLREGIFLIVDDVITTGATIEACAKAMNENGTRRIIACSVALADHSTVP